MMNKAVEDKPDAEGWIPYDGKCQPVADDVIVMLNCAGYNTVHPQPAKDVSSWDGFDPKYPSNRIVAYRIIEKPESEPQTLLEYFKAKNIEPMSMRDMKVVSEYLELNTRRLDSE
jgi:hypothetical protein